MSAGLLCSETLPRTNSLNLSEIKLNEVTLSVVEKCHILNYKFKFTLVEL